MKGYTQFGEFVRMLRIQTNQVMGDMAKLLDVSVPFLSAVETGKKNIPAEWESTLVNVYNLDQENTNKLKAAIEASKCQIKVSFLV